MSLPPHSSPGSLDLDLLPEEWLSVDNIFDHYVSELSQRSKRQSEAGLLQPPDAKQLRLGSPLAAAAAASPFSLGDGAFLDASTAATAQLGALGSLAGGALQQQAAAATLAGGGLQLGAGGLGGLAGHGGPTNPLAAALLQQQHAQHAQHAALLQQQGLPAGTLPGSGLGLFPAGFSGSLPGAAAAAAAAAAIAAGQPKIALQSEIPPAVLLGAGGPPSGLPPSVPVPVRSSGGDDSAGAYSDDQGAAADSQPGGKKSVKQQEANKIAQARYREKKKAKFHEMEQQIETLHAQLAQLGALQSRNAILESTHTELAAKLAERQQEVERLKGELQGAQAGEEQGAGAAAAASVPAPAAPGGSCCGPAAAAGGCSAAAPGAAAPAAAGAVAGPSPGGAGAGGASEGTSSGMPACCDLLPRNLSGVDFKSGFSDQVARLRQLVEQHQLRSVPVTGETLPRPLLVELAQAVGRACQLGQAALRVEGDKVLDQIDRDPRSLGAADEDDKVECDRWRRVLDAMKLIPGQIRQLLMLRQSHLAKMRLIYEERQKLNLEAMALMLPHQSRNPLEDNTVEGRLTNISSCGYLAIARTNAELGAVLDRVKDNLRLEQRACMDINCTTVSKILSPVQAALYMLDLYPTHCDALALTNVLARKVGQEDLGIPVGRCPNAATCPKVAAGICNGFNCLTLGIETGSSTCQAGNKFGGRGNSS